MLLGTKLSVIAVFLLLGVSFIAGTGLLIWEFGVERAFIFATHDSHLFLFFPTLGLVALAAFYLPICTFVDLYWCHLPMGRLRLIGGIVVLAAISYSIGSGLANSEYRSVFDLSPETLARDKSEPAGCGASGAKPCERIALIEGIENVARVSRARLGLKDFVRACQPEPLLEKNKSAEGKRFCFASTPYSDRPTLTSDEQCCASQKRYQSTITQLYETEQNRSATGIVHGATLPLKVFFLLILLAISFLLAVRHEEVAKHYPQLAARIDVAVLVGAIAMLFFPLMCQGFVQTADALYGVHQDGGFKPIVPVMSFFFCAWALLLLLFFFRKYNGEMEMAAKMAGVAASIIAVFKYDLLVALSVRLLGSGAGELTVYGMVILSAIATVILFSRSVHLAVEKRTKKPSPPATM